MSIEVSPETESARAGIYDGFVSYSHAADDLLAPRLQSGLQRFAKPWWRRRALRIFRDESSLSANPHLWSSITQALDESAWFVLLLSPDAAESEWVNQEIEYWKTHKDPERILPVLTAGTFEWEGSEITGSSVPEQLKDVFAEEPRWVDMRFARDEEQLDLKNPRFADAVADIASAVRGIAKDELASEEVRQHRRTIRTAWAAGTLVLLLAITAGMAAFQASRNAREAERQAAIAEENAIEAQAQRDAALSAEEEAQRQARLARARELGAASVEALDSDPRLARILALEAVNVTNITEEIPTTVVNALWRSLYEDRLVKEVETGLAGFTPIVLSEDGSRFVLSSDEGKTAVTYSAPETEELWRYTDPDADVFGIASISPNGSQVAVGVVNRGNPDGEPTRVMILDGDDGSVIEVFEYPECPSIEVWGWSPDGSSFVSNHGIEPCPRDEAPGGIWAEVRDAITWESLAVIESEDPFVAEPIFDAEGNLYVFGIESPVRKYAAEGFAQIAEFNEAFGLGDVASDGSKLATYTPFRSVGLRIVDTESGAVVDNLTPVPGIPVYGIGIRFSSDGSELAVATEDQEAVVWGTEIGQRLHVLPAGPSNSIVLSPDSRWIYTSHPGGTIRLWDRGPRSVNTSISGDLGDHPFVNANSFNIGQRFGTVQTVDPGGDCVPFCSRVRLFDPDTGLLTESAAEGFRSQPMPDGTIAIQSAEGSWDLFDPVTEAIEALPDCFTYESGECVDLSESPDLGVMVSLDGSEVALRRIHDRGSETLTVLDPESWGVVEETAVDFQIMAFSDSWILGDRDFLEFVVAERDTGDEMASGEVSTGRWEISPSGKVASVMTFEGDIALIEFDTWDFEVFDLDVGQVRGMGFSPDDRLIALGDQTDLHILDFEQGFVTQTIPIPGVSDIYWLDEETIVIGTNDGIWATVSLRIDDLIASAREASVPRVFTAQECVTYRIVPCPADN